MESIEYYQNPLLTAETPEAWPGYGFGDPFVMRHNGMYYLYVSTKDGSIGVKCWSSPDLVNWTYEGYCTNEKITKGAYAPEVFYYNGYFYMYTSPGGNGHYVLRSTSPTKGFKVITDNMGMSIDGSVFINNNGRWYFYTAGAGAMRAYEMTSPSSMQKGSVLDEITVNGGWTEGPMTVYHDGYYYMTYTGNHVLSPSYRIYYGVSSRSPLSFSAGKPSNPLLINTSEEIFGIGHSSTVKGPDLDSYYLVYHSLVNKTPNRNTSIDRIVFNRESMKVMGPTVSPQQVPDLPDVYHRFEAGSSLKGRVGVSLESFAKGAAGRAAAHWVERRRKIAPPPPHSPSRRRPE
jgi:beta-xylosidase